MELKVDRSVSRIKAGCRPGNGIEQVFFTFQSFRKLEITPYSKKQTYRPDWCLFRRERLSGLGLGGALAKKRTIRSTKSTTLIRSILDLTPRLYPGNTNSVIPLQYQ